jgi:methionyl-tRNA formyltransferase
MKIVYMGTPLYAKNILTALAEESRFEIVAVFTQPDKPVGRKKVITPPEVKVAAEAAGLPVYQPYDLNNPESIALIREFAPDFIVVAAYGQLLKREILDIAPCINLHASILPDYRGASPIQETLLNGDRFAGVTAMRMEEGLDNGDMLGFSYLEGVDLKTSEDLMEELSFMAAALTKDLLLRFDTVRPLPQHGCDARYVKKRTKQEAEVSFDAAVAIDRKYRAFYPWPGIFLSSGLALKNVRLHESESNNPAGIILAMHKDHIIVGCTQGSLRIDTLQAPSKNETDAPSYLRGKRVVVGDTLS